MKKIYEEVMLFGIALIVLAILEYEALTNRLRGRK